MSDSLLLLQNLKWSDSFEDLPLDLCLYPQVFNMFVAAVNERLVVAARWTEHLQFQGSNPGGSSIDGYFRRYYGTLPGQGTFQYAVEVIKINTQSHKILPINEVSNKSVMALGVPDSNFYGHLNAEDLFRVLDKIGYPVPKDFNIKTYKFDLESDAGVNNWVWLQGVVGFLAFFFAKQDGLADAAALGDQINIASWRSVYDKYTTLESLETKIKPHSYAIVPSEPLPEAYAQVDNYYPAKFRRAYPRTIVRLDDAGLEGQVARLIAGDTTHEIKNPNYDPNVGPSPNPFDTSNSEYIKVTDPAYAEIKNNYHKLYIYDVANGHTTLDARGNEVFVGWRLVTDEESIVNPDIVLGKGWIERGDYFGPWILEDIRKALNLFKYVVINKYVEVLLSYTSPGYGANDHVVPLLAPAVKGDTFINAKSNEIKVGRYALTGNPNKIVDAGDGWFVVEHPIEVNLNSVAVSDDYRVFMYQNAQPENHFDPVPIIYSGNLPLGGSGLYYPGFSLTDLNRTASYTPQKYAWVQTQVARVAQSGNVETFTLICSMYAEMGDKIKTVHYFLDEYLGNAKPAKILDYVQQNGWNLQYDLGMLDEQTYPEDRLYCFVTGTMNSDNLQSTGFPIWSFAIVEFEFEYRGE